MCNECCPDNKRGCNWGVGSNMPGYMPDSDVQHYQSYDDALHAYFGEIERALDDEAEAHENGTGSEYDELCATFDAHRALLLKRFKARTKRTEAQFQVGQYVYWVSRI